MVVVVVGIGKLLHINLCHVFVVKPSRYLTKMSRSHCQTTVHIKIQQAYAATEY